MTAQPPQPSKLFSRWDILLAILVGVLSMALYTRTLAPWVLPADSGEFQVLAYQVGIAHTTGYPVYMLLGKLFITLVPVSDVAYRANLFSAFAGALTVAGTYLCAKLLSKSHWAALVGALALAVSYTLWSQSLIAEVYSPGAAFLVAVWLALLVWYKSGNRWALFASGVCGGLGLGVHGNLVIVAPAVGIFLLLNWKRWKEWRKPALLGALTGVVAFFVGYFIVDLHAPPANIFDAGYGSARSAWGLSEADINNPVARAVFILSARQWRGRMFDNPAKYMVANLLGYVTRLPREFTLLMLGLLVLGLIVLFIRDWRAGILFVVALVMHWVFYFNYRVGDQYVFFIPSYVWMAMLAAVGMGGLAWLIGRMPGRPVQMIASLIVMLAIVYEGVVPMLAPYWSAVQQGKVPFAGQRGYVVHDRTETNYKVASNVVKELEPNAIVFQNWDVLYQYWYAASIEHKRTDLRFIEQNPFHEPSTLAQSTIEFIRANIDVHPIYLAAQQREVEQAGFKLRAVTVSQTRLYKVEK